MLSVVLEGTPSQGAGSIVILQTYMKQVLGKKVRVDQQLSKSTVKQVDRIRKALLSITDAIKTIGKMGLSLEGHRDNSRHQDIGESAYHAGASNLNSLILHFEREIKLCNIL